MEKELKRRCLLCGLRDIAGNLFVNYSEEGWKMDGVHRISEINEIIKELESLETND